MRFLIDANLPRTMAPALRRAGHECDHVAILLRADADDLAIAEIANRTDSILVTKDFDFVDLHKRGVLRAPLVRIGLGNMSSAFTTAIVLSRLEVIAALIKSGQSIIEIR